MTGLEPRAVRIGTSGWSYDHWRGHLYPPGTTSAGRLDAYTAAFGDADLDWWAERIAEWRGAGHAVVAYFNNDGAGHAVHDARRLVARLMS